MPKLKPTAKQQYDKLVASVIAAQQERYDVTDKQIAKLLGVEPITVGRKKREPSRLNLREMQAMDSLLHFTPMQAASLILGRDVRLEDF